MASVRGRAAGFRRPVDAGLCSQRQQGALRRVTLDLPDAIVITQSRIIAEEGGAYGAHQVGDSRVADTAVPAR